MVTRDEWYYEVVRMAQNHKQILLAVRIYPLMADGAILPAIDRPWIDDLTRQLFKRAYLAATPTDACASA